MQGYTFDLRYGLSDMVVIEMREASTSALENMTQANTRMIGIVFAPLPEFVNGKPEKLWYRFKGVPPKVRELAGKIVPTLGGQVLLSTMITTSEVRQRLEHAIDSVNKVEDRDLQESALDKIRHSVGTKLQSMFSRKPLKQLVEEQRLAKKARDEQLRVALLLKNTRKMQMLKHVTMTKALPAMARPLTHLDLSSSCVHDGDAIPIILQATNLTVLRLSHCSNLTTELFASVISDSVALREAAGAPLRKLETLSMRNTPACNDAAVIRICAAATSLHSLDIGESQRRVTNASVSVLAEAVGSRLKRLMIDSCPGLLHFSPHLSPATRHSPHVTRHTSHVTRHTSPNPKSTPSSFSTPSHLSPPPPPSSLHSGNRRFSKHAACSRGSQLQHAGCLVSVNIVVCDVFPHFYTLAGAETEWRFLRFISRCAKRVSQQPHAQSK